MNLNTLFVVAVDRLPASEMIFALRDQVLGGAGRYHIGGYGHVAEVCADYVVEQGGLYLTKTRVQSILVEEGRAVGVRVDGRDIRARAVISNAGIQPTVLKLAGAEHFPAEYVERVTALEPSWAICGFRYVLDKRIFDAALIPVFSDESWLDEAALPGHAQGQVAQCAADRHRRAVGVRPRPVGYSRPPTGELPGVHAGGYRVCASR